tara:strand:+ start:739 stop:1125 length:387 start_codon:yes stop_codon:yes gene_type:complete
MTKRTYRTTIHFNHPFKLYGFNKVLPSGYYEVDTEEELIEGFSFTAYRRTQVSLHLHIDSNCIGKTEVLTLLDPKELDAALLRDIVMGRSRLLARAFHENPQPTQGQFDLRALDRGENEGMYQGQVLA